MEHALPHVDPSSQLRGVNDVRGDRDDASALAALGYKQELRRGMSGFSNYAISLSIICILAGGVTSFHVGFGAAGGASIGIGWPLSCLGSLAVALAMAQVASAFPTAGGLYHWASILGGRGFGWLTAWCNLAGLVTVLTAINVGTYQFTAGALGPFLGFDPSKWTPSRALVIQGVCVLAITASQALVNHLGIRATTRLTDLSGYWILIVATALTLAMVGYAPHLAFGRLVTFTNYSGAAGADVWPKTASMAKLFVLGFLLPAYTVTGFDASAHTSEETVSATENVPRGIVRSVLVSGAFGLVMLASVVAAAPDADRAAAEGTNAFVWIVNAVVPKRVAATLFAGIAVAQYLCGLATVTSASRMAYAFARDGGLPASRVLAAVHARWMTPVASIWAVSLASVAFAIYTPVYTTITAVCTVLLYISYAIPITLGVRAYKTRWRAMGSFSLGALFRPIGVVAVLFCVLLIGIGVQPPNEKALWVLTGAAALAALLWFGLEKRRFRGIPAASLDP